MNHTEFQHVFSSLCPAELPHPPGRWRSHTGKPEDPGWAAISDWRYRHHFFFLTFVSRINNALFKKKIYRYYHWPPVLLTNGTWKLKWNGLITEILSLPPQSGTKTWAGLRRCLSLPTVVRWTDTKVSGKTLDERFVQRQTGSSSPKNPFSLVDVTQTLHLMANLSTHHIYSLCCIQ